MLNYSDYTKRNHVTKAIRMELLPQGATEQTISDKGDRKYDKELYAALERLKPVIDSFIISLMNDALSKIEFDFEPMYLAITEKNKKLREKEEKALIKAIDKSLTDSMPGGLKLSQINSAKFMQGVLSEYVKHTNDTTIKKDEAVKDIEMTNGCLSLFNKFLTTRITALTTWLPKRLLENFDIYISNISRIENVLSEGGELTEGILNELNLMKSISFYDQVLSQRGIDGYNSIISGEYDGDITSVKSINVRIKEYNTRIKNEKIDKRYLRIISPLYKLPLIPAEKKFKIKSINSDDEVRDVIKSTWGSFSDLASKMVNLLEDKLQTSDGKGILIQGNRVHALSHLITGAHKTITDNLVNAELIEINEMLSSTLLKPSMRKELEKRAENIQSLVIKRNYEFTELDEAVKNTDMSSLAPTKSAFKMYVECISTLYNITKMTYKILEGGDIFSKRRIKGDRHIQELLVDFFNSLTDIRDALGLLNLQNDEENVDIAFYNTFDELYSEIRLTYKAENLVRNYVTKSTKDIAEEKQTCFGSPARLRTQWWNGETKFAKNNAAIIKRDGKYYYFVLSGDAKPIEIKETDSDTVFLTLKKGQKSFMMLPKILFSDHVVPFFEENKDAEEYSLDDDSVIRPVKVEKSLYEIYKNGLFKREAVTSGIINEEEYACNIRILIEKYMEFAKVYTQYQKFNLDDINDSTRYNDIGEFFSDIDTCTSRLSWTHIDFKQIENLVNNGIGYLFQISNKFILTGSEDKNTYTKTLLSILSESNMDKTTMLLNSNPAVFFRPQAIKRTVTHKAGSIMVNRLTTDGEHIPKRIYEAIYKIKNEIPNVSEEDAKAANEYIETHNVRWFKAKYDKTYRENYMSDKYILQLTYTKNNDVSDRLNDKLNDRISEAISDGFNIVSVARSTKDMVYVMVLDNELNILKETSLNIIDNIDYYALLHDSYIEKKEDKKIWVYDTENADLKSAYIDHAITEILKLAKVYNAVIVVESISDAVKNKYAFLDNQVFKGFENRLAQRLSDLTFKEIMEGRPGSISNPLQLANNNGNTYQDGVLFFVNGAYTRGIEPSSGFTSLFDFPKYKSIASKRQFFSKMANISYTGDAFVFNFDYADYPVKLDTDKTKWQVKISGDAVVYDREKKQNKHIKDVVNEMIIPLAGKTDLNSNIAENILNKEVPGVFVEEMFKWFRYSITGTHAKYNNKEAFYKSPVNGKEYDISSMQAFNLAKKLIFRLGYTGENKDFTTEWLNYLQS